jgi:Capsular polysaccharide biosynthesis protein
MERIEAISQPARNFDGPKSHPISQVLPLIDIHVHFLPGIDDGPASLEEALAMVKLAVTDGIQAAVVTPHHLNGVYTNEAGRIREEVEAFQEALADGGWMGGSAGRRARDRYLPAGVA